MTNEFPGHRRREQRPRLFFVRPGFDEQEELAKQPPLSADEEPWYVVLRRAEDTVGEGSVVLQ